MTVEMELEPRIGRPSPELILQLRLHALRTSPSSPLRIVSGEGPDTRIGRREHLQTGPFLKVASSGGRGRLVSAPPALLSCTPGISQSNGINREGPGYDLGAQGVREGFPGHSMSVSLSPDPQHPPRPPTPSVFTRRLSLPQPPS